MNEKRYQILDADTGALTEADGDCPHCEIQAAHFEEIIKGLEKDLRTKRAQIIRLTKQKEDELRLDPLYVQAQALHHLHQVATGKRRKLDANDLANVYSCLRNSSFETCCYAIAGSCFDPYVSRQRNGRQKRHNGFSLVFRNLDKLYGFVDKAPAHWSPSPNAISEITETPLADVEEWLEGENKRSRRGR